MAALFAVALAASIALTVHLWGNVDHAPALGGWARPLAVAAVAACAMMAVAAWRRAVRAAAVERPLRLGFYVLTLTWLSALLHPYEQGASYYSFILGGGVLAALDVFGPALRRRLGARTCAVADVALMNLCVIAVGAELSLRVVARVTRSPLLAQEASDARDWLAANRLRAGELRFGFPVNSHGLYDDEPRQRPCVAAIGDSFTVGVVPHAYHFTTVAESALGCAVDAIGVVAVGPEEYALLLRDEALPRDPGVVVVDLFVGNDIVDNLRGRDHFRGGMRRWLDRDNLLLYAVPKRLRALARERGRLGHAAGDVPHVEAARPLTDEETLRQFPWIADPAREPPSMSHATYVDLAARHAREVCGGDDAASYARLFEILEQMRAAAAPRPFALVLIPDEFQVEDPLWREVSARAAGPLDRERPQRLLSAWLRKKAIPFLDLLPLLRAEPVGPDGRRHLFHRDDSHLNARGNAVAGRALGAFLRPLLPAR